MSRVPYLAPFVVGLLAGCSSSSSTDSTTDAGSDAVADSAAGTDSSATDFGTADVAETSAADSAGVPGISGAVACGTTNCKLPGSACCAAVGDRTVRACQPIADPCTNALFECDDSSECPKGSVCCGPMANGKKIACVPEAACAIGPEVFIYCTSADNCPASRPQCNDSPSGFKTCMP